MKQNIIHQTQRKFYSKYKHLLIQGQFNPQTFPRAIKNHLNTHELIFETYKYL